MTPNNWESLILCEKQPVSLQSKVKSIETVSISISSKPIERRVRRKSHARCEAGEKTESGAVAPLRSYLSLLSLPDDFDKLLATMRSRNISVSIIIQNIAQLKALFEKQWESIIGNCDEFLYLGGNETSTHKLISENYLGKSTLWLDTYGKSTGHSGSYSTNNQITGRELMTPDEVRMLDNNLALLFIRGEAPLMDEKYDLLKHPNIKYTTDGGAPVYSHGGTENAVADMTIGRLTPGDLANIQEPETLYELLSDEDMENIFQFKEDTQNETVS